MLSMTSEENGNCVKMVNWIIPAPELNCLLKAFLIHGFLNLLCLRKIGECFTVLIITSDNVLPVYTKAEVSYLLFIHICISAGKD